MNILNQKVLVVNGNWQAINIRTVQDAFVAMNGGDENNPPVKAIDITYGYDEDGNPDFETTPEMREVSWVEWMALPIREYDLVINTANMKIRVPTVVSASNFKKVPKKRFYPNKRNLYEKQRGICGLTGKRISFNQANIEHKIPRSKGGRDTWENLMVAEMKANSVRGNKPYEELGLKPLFHHKEPAPIPVSFTFKDGLHKDWKWFLGQ
jgi:5-methylcytosine-specific restriction endonuclease McrA